MEASLEALINTSLVLIDVRGDILFSLKTDSNGQIPTQLITRAVYDYEHKTGNENGPHLLLVKKYGKNFQEIAKEFSAATIETLQVSSNIFRILSEAGAQSLTNLLYNPPTKVNYGYESNSSWHYSGQLKNSPVDQCQYYAIFANGTKLIEGASGTGNYTLDYE